MSCSKRQDLIDAFFALAMQQRTSRFGVKDICQKAGVARATFYAHFRSREELLMATIAPVIDTLAQELLCSGSFSALAHIWEQRRLSELWRDPAFRDRFADALGAALSKHAGLTPISARFAAGGVVSALRDWTAGRFSASPEDLAQWLGAMVQGAFDDGAVAPEVARPEVRG